MPRAGSDREPKLRPTCWRSFVRPTHVARVVGRHWRPRGKRPGRASGGRPCVTRHGRHRSSPALHVTRKTRSRRLAVAPLHHGAPRWLHLPRAGSGGGSKVKAHVLALICPFTACCGSPSVPSSWQAPLACKRRKAVRYTSQTTPLVTCVTRHAQNAKPTSRCRTVAPWSIPLHHGAPRCDGCYHPETDGEKLVRTGINGCSAMAHPLT